MRPKYFALVICALIACSQCAIASVGSEAPKATVEVTSEDFTACEKIDSTRLTTFGVGLGQSMDEMLRALRPYEKRLRLAQKPRPSPETGEFAVEIEDSTGALLALVVLRDGSVARIEWYTAMSDYLAGSSARLLRPEAGDADSDLRMSLLGREDDVTVSSDIGRVSDVTTFTFSYDSEGMRIERTLWRSLVPGVPSFDGIAIHLVRPARVR